MKKSKYVIWDYTRIDIKRAQENRQTYALDNDPNAVLMVCKTGTYENRKSERHISPNEQPYLFIVEYIHRPRCDIIQVRQ
jgi:hypothetical protein